MASELAFSLRVPGRLELALELPAGLTVVLGPSGAGKSTLLSALAGLVHPCEGFIELAGRTLFHSERKLDLPPWHRNVALVFQSLALFPHMTARENVAFGLKAEPPAHALAWLERMHVQHLAERKPATLSGGEAQRVALARALASRPALLLLDEPFSALHASLRAELAAEVSAVVRELTIPAILVTHQQQDAASLSERVVHMEHGALARAPV